MERELLDLLRQVTGDATALVRLYIIWYFVYWTAVNFTIGGVLGGFVWGGYRLIKRWQDHEIDKWNRRGGY